MHIVIAITLFCAAVVSPFGIPREMVMYLPKDGWRGMLGGALAMTMLLWFSFAAYWMLKYG